jgi:RNA polymerase sigma factor (TIGR02999 family)
VQKSDVPVTELLRLAAEGEREALDRVFDALYQELRQIARGRLHQQRGLAGLDTTALVHEGFLKMAAVSGLSLTDRKHFFTYAAKVMRNIIIDFAREHLAQRRGGGAEALQLTTGIASQLGDGSDESILRINDALLALESLDPELSQVVEMRYFAGYTEVEVAELLGSSERSVRRQWEKARAFLFATLRE